jgi:hypothetical protein
MISFDSDGRFGLPDMTRRGFQGIREQTELEKLRGLLSP